MKVGCMVFLVHDVNDIFMEAARLARYAGCQILCTVLFVIFMLSWFASRIYYLPAYIIRSCLTEPVTVRSAPSSTLCWQQTAHHLHHPAPTWGAKGLHGSMFVAAQSFPFFPFFPSLKYQQIAA